MGTALGTVLLGFCAAACGGSVTHSSQASQDSGEAAGAAGDSGVECVAPACLNPPSCAGLAATCGPNGNESCCAARVVPGGTFLRTYDGVTEGFLLKSYPATVSDFALDTYEITVGRFRSFAAGYPGNMPADGAGKNPNNPADTGWVWSASMPVDQNTLVVGLQCESRYQTWTAGNDNLPLNCLTWFAAEAFCIWDGGRLPTEAELNYADAGGAEQRVYPWGNATPDATRAVFLPASGGAAAAVGSVPAGNGRWGQADLSGNLWEWAEDWLMYPRSTAPCDNCADLSSGMYRVIRGGSFNEDASELSAAFSGEAAPESSSQLGGARCARDVP